MCEYVDEGGRCVRCDDVEGVKGFVKDHQQYAMIKHHLSRQAVLLFANMPTHPQHSTYLLVLLDMYM